ncbi:unnamed protein product [Hymenolepis diminuta]|uniref:Tubulin domain-containing protein n=1 Tax=Hymenolepis diminuta TaxID=6216 RepID=A0A564Y245_HYMDI|nr:unnamed protein product [Hymenolepis diminuta]
MMPLVGQCGNQIGHRFWDLALREHAASGKSGQFDDSMQTFFYPTKNSGIKSRSVLIDMEEGVVKSLLRSPIGGLFENTHFVTDVPGSGNNWAVGYYEHGTKHSGRIMEAIRKGAELCDCLQCFFILHSMGGGTGLVTAVFPSVDDDVIISPYNTVLAIDKLTELADCVISVENGALERIVNRIQKDVQERKEKYSSVSGTVIDGTGSISGGKSRAFDEVNNIVANMLLNLTSSARFPGTMNVDLNEISMNLVPFPRLHYLIAAQSPFASYSSVISPRNIDQIFQDVFSRDYQLISTNPRDHTILATALLLRGPGCASDIRRNIDRLQERLRFVDWNREGWKVGHCWISPVGQKTGALLALSNSTAITPPFTALRERMNRLLRRKAHLHHYSSTSNGNFDALSALNQADESLSNLINVYEFFNNSDNTETHFDEHTPVVQIAD